MPSLTLLVPGDPVAKERPRMNRTTGNVYTPSKTRNAELYLKTLLTHAGARPDALHYYSIALGFQMRPGEPERDLDNLIKLVMDSANRTVWRDDRQVTHIDATMWRAQAPPHTMIVITQEGERTHGTSRRRRN